MAERYQATADGLVEFVKRCYSSPNIYLWCGVGEYITDEVLDEKKAASPGWYTKERQRVRREMVGHNVRGWDCIGLIQSYTWGDYHQNNTRYCWPEEFLTTSKLIKMDLVKGDISTLPERPGLVLWREHHVGVYIGNGEVIECTSRILNGTQKGEHGIVGGIVKTKLEDLDWAVWLQFPGIEY